MSNYRPAGLSDDDSDYDDYGFFDKPERNYPVQQKTEKQKLEINLQDAIINGSLKDVEDILSLVSSDNNVNVKLDSGWTPLMHACFHAHEKIVEYLLDKGADPNMHSDSVTPMMVVCSNSSASNDSINNIVSKLIEKGCLLNVGDKYGHTPLMRSISSARVGVVQQLIDGNVNIEMRDQMGWTAVFWAVHHNQPEILELLIAVGARLSEVDKRNRSLLDIAQDHDYQNIVEIINKHTYLDEGSGDQTVYCSQQEISWHDYYPGLTENGKNPEYKCEIPRLLYGMNSEALTRKIENGGIDLRAFLLLNESDMIRLGIDMPYERQRLKYGLHQFHKKAWKLNAVAGLYARKMKSYSVMDCLTTLGSHYQQLYILEATIQYTLREYNSNHNLKFEPPGSKTLTAMAETVAKVYSNINNIRREIKTMKALLQKIKRCNPPPADLIVEKHVHEKMLQYAPKLFLLCSLGVLYHTISSLRK